MQGTVDRPSSPEAVEAPFLAQLWAVARKDLLLEARSRERLLRGPLSALGSGTGPAGSGSTAGSTSCVVTATVLVTRTARAKGSRSSMRSGPTEARPRRSGQ